VSVTQINNSKLGVRWLLIGVAMLLTVLVIVMPIIIISQEALRLGLGAYVQNLMAPDTRHAIGLTVLTAIIVVPINVLFGIAAAWLIAKHEFRGKKHLITLIELPLAISPIIAGVTYLFLYGDQGLFGPWLKSHDIRITFSVPAIILVSIFVTSPFVARELIPLMQTQGTEHEEAAISLGASGFKTFFLVTLPSIKWALLYGTLLCNARVIGEFGAVSVVSGSIRGKTNTLPLQIELLYNDYNTVGAFAAASILTLLALLTLVARVILERREKRDLDPAPPAETAWRFAARGH
jgi:sulfate transport system permease protein